MHDTCILRTRISGAVDEFNVPQQSWQTSAPLDCGLTLARSRELMPGTEVPIYDARLRLAHDTELTSFDRIRVTHRYGEHLLVPLEFEVVGEPRLGPSGLVLDLRTVMEGT